MNTRIRSTLLAAGLLLGAHAAMHAQTPDSIFTVSSDGQNLLRLNTDAGFVVRGTPDVGEIPAEGGGVRMMWFPARWAFRAGKVDSYGATYWDLERIGNGSMALGVNARASGYASFAAGEATTASGAGSTALGALSTATGDTSFAAVMGTATGKGAVAIGSDARATSDYALALGQGARALGGNAVAIGPNEATGFGAVAMGVASSASGDRSVAIGWFAATNNKRGSIVLADYCMSFPGDTVYPTADSQFIARACGGVEFYTSLDRSAGVKLAPGGSSWLTVSDVNRKENFEVLDGEDVLRRLREVPVMTWNYKSQDAGIRHAGPTAQDFHAAFGLGESELMINTVDIDGINLAAVKALEARTRELREATAEIEELRGEVAAQKQRIEALERRQREILERLERIESRR